MRKDADRLQDILMAIEAIERHLINDQATFISDEMLQVWYLRHIEIIGEDSTRLSPGIRERYQEIQWREIIGMRNMLIHGSFDVDWEAVWQIVQRDLPLLKINIQYIIKIENK